MQGFKAPVYIRGETRVRQKPSECVAPVPRPFDFGFSARRPLVPLAAAELFLNKRPREVMALIECGQLRWAFDIRTGNARAREVRIWRDSLFEYTRLRPREQFYPDDEKEFAAMMLQMLPVAKEPRRRKGRLPGSLPFVRQSGPGVSAVVVAQCFSCTPGHIFNLVHDRLLNPTAPRAPQAPLVVTPASVMDFLRQRRIF